MIWYAICKILLLVVQKFAGIHLNGSLRASFLSIKKDNWHSSKTWRTKAPPVSDRLNAQVDPPVPSGNHNRGSRTFANETDARKRPRPLNWSVYAKKNRQVSVAFHFCKSIFDETTSSRKNLKNAACIEPSMQQGKSWRSLSMKYHHIMIVISLKIAAPSWQYVGWGNNMNFISMREQKSPPALNNMLIGVITSTLSSYPPEVRRGATSGL